MEDSRLWSIRSLIWLANSCVCLTAYMLHSWTLLWFLNTRVICNNRQSNSDHIIKTVTHTCVVWHYCQIQYSRQKASSFSFKLSENPASNCALFVNESPSPLVRNFINNKVHQIKFIVWFLCRPPFAALVIYTLHVVTTSVGGAKQAVLIFFGGGGV